MLKTISLPLRTERRPLLLLTLQPVRCLPSVVLVVGVDMVPDVDVYPVTLTHND